MYDYPAQLIFLNYEGVFVTTGQIFLYIRSIFVSRVLHQTQTDVKVSNILLARIRYSVLPVLFIWDYEDIIFFCVGQVPIWG